MKSFFKPWLFLVGAAGIVVAGCGGSGSKGTATSTATTAGTLSIASVNLPTDNGLVNVDYLTGQGRAPGSIVANINSANLIDAAGNIASETLNPQLNLLLDGYTYQIQPIDVGATPTSHLYNKFELVIPTLQVVQNDGSLGSPITGPGGNFAIDQFFSANISALGGRQTSVQIYLDDATVNIDGNNQPTFDRTTFLANNTTTSNPYITSFIGDYVMFDISDVAARPTMPDGQVATRVYFSGEDQRYAVSGSAYGGDFQVFTPSGFLTGSFAGPNQVSGNGSYTLRTPDPRDLAGIAKITSLQGIWRPVGQVVNNLGNFEVITFPHSKDDQFQDVIAMVSDANGHVTNFYFGLADLSALTFQLFPIADVTTGATNGEIDGKLSSLVDASAGPAASIQAARAGTYTFTSASLPTGFRTTGRFVIFRA